MTIATYYTPQHNQKNSYKYIYIDMYIFIMVKQLISIICGEEGEEEMHGMEEKLKKTFIQNLKFHPKTSPLSSFLKHHKKKAISFKLLFSFFNTQTEKKYIKTCFHSKCGLLHCQHHPKTTTANFYFMLPSSYLFS